MSETQYADTTYGIGAGGSVLDIVRNIGFRGLNKIGDQNADLTVVREMVCLKCMKEGGRLYK